MLTEINGLPEATGLRPIRALQLAVVEFDGRWDILVNGRRVAGFNRKADATRCVLDIAGQTRCDGYPVQVSVEDAAGAVPPHARRSPS